MFARKLATSLAPPVESPMFPEVVVETPGAVVLGGDVAVVAQAVVV
jgi:hypothetical protein